MFNFVYHKMKKKIKKYGNSLVIIFDKEEIEWYGLEEGEWIDIGSIIKVNPEEMKEELV